MNILPLVFAFILIFSFLTLGFIQEHTHSILSEKSLKSFHSTSRIAANAVAQKLYKKTKTAPPTPAPNAPPSSLSGPVIPQTRKTHQSQRALFPALDNAKFNLYPLLELKTNPKNHPLYEICAELLRVLYDEPLFTQTKLEGAEYDLLNAMLAIYRDKADVKELCDLYPDAPDLKLLFYKMLKGTNQYHLESHNGIPPLEEFFTLNKKASIHFSFASIPLLEALFGKKTSLKILSEEKKKYEVSGKKAGLTQDELTALLVNDPQMATRVLELGQHLDFSQKPIKRTMLSKKDKRSGLVVKKKL